MGRCRDPVADPHRPVAPVDRPLRPGHLYPRRGDGGCAGAAADRTPPGAAAAPRARIGSGARHAEIRMKWPLLLQPSARRPPRRRHRGDERLDARDSAAVTIASPRGVVEARALVTTRIPTLRADGREIHQVGLHWGTRGLVTGDSANDLVAISEEPNVRIMETKGLVCHV